MQRLWILLALPLGLMLSFSGSDGKKPAKMSEAEATSHELTDGIDSTLAAHWEEHGEPAPEVDDLTFARRLWLDLLGTIPSLQEVKAIEALPQEGRRQALVEMAMSDPRFSEVLAERLARITVGAGSKPDDLIYRRRRLIAWLTAQVEQNRPWDELVRELITAEGLSTDTPAVNFTISQDSDPVKLAARSSRAFMGIRIDCAQCHDHPYFPQWTQAKFEGLAAWYSRVETDVAGVREKESGELEFLVPEDADPDKPGQPILATKKNMKEEPDSPTRAVEPQVPFGQEYLDENAPSRRAALAAWLTHPDNPYFAKAIVNRLWHWLMGRGLVEPVDELDTNKPRHEALLELLARDFVDNGYSLRRTIRAIVSTRAYRLSSAAPEGEDEFDAVEDWRVYPLKPLRGDQLASAILQSGSLRTHDRKRFLLLRFARYIGRNEFIKRHADDLDAEDPEEETLLQRLHLLNGKTVTNVTNDNDGFAPVVRLPLLSSSDEAAVDAAFLMTLTRRPSPALREHFVSKLEACVNAKGEPDNDARSQVMADLQWALINTTEFAWTR